MQSSKNKNVDTPDPFYRLSVPRQKTSAEIINEARNALRTLRSQRPLTPREYQRKLFGSASSRTPDDRPPSAFSLHASSFESSESRPISGARLSPLDHKPKLFSSPTKDQHSSTLFPKPPVDPLEVRKVSSARARLFRTTSWGSVPDENKERLNSEDPAMTGDLSKRSNENCLAELSTHSHIKDDGILLMYKERNMSEKQDFLKGSAAEPPLQLSGSDQIKKHGRAASCPSNADWDKSGKQEGLKDDSKLNESEEEENYWNVKILPILRELESEDNIEKLCLACTSLYQALEEGHMLGKRFKRRTVLLKTLYKLVDIGSDPLCLKLAIIILAMKVSGKNMLSVCKLAFKICRNEKNDFLIQNDKLLDYLLEVLRIEDLQANNEALLYCMGAIKFISGNAAILNEMANKGAVEILLQLVKQINNIRENDTHFSSLGHLLVQLTATLRNLVDLRQSRCQFLCSDAISELCEVLEQRISDKDVCTNIARIFSKLSSYNDCCAALADCSRCYILFLALLNKHQKKQDLVVRIVFILGNLTAKNNQAREQFFKEKGCVSILTSLFQIYGEFDMNEKKRKHEAGEEKKTQKHPSEAEDVLIKLIRVLANLSIHPSIGAALAANHYIVALLVMVLEYKSIDDCEELVISATATLNSLSYYQVRNSAVQDKKLHIAELLLKLLMSSNMDGILEAVRVFGNLSQYHEICDFIVKRKIYKFMIALLDAKHQDVCFSACGVLLNLTVDKNKRGILKEEGGIRKLIDCLRDFGPTDWQLACLICKTLWNYSENITNAASCFGEEDISTLLMLLASLLDEEVALDYNFDNDLRDYHKMYWETEFKPVAEKLLSRLQRQLSFFQPITVTSF
ncbi:PREDICTED: armadillo repeat-containing protein 2 isoform X1 [Gavialis gangeticus]|uniref:armadillo repeat-containing protein 2 isoform X1 n=2 Tax=Gavialis gangeticus TaxID=94835 RepID=UPI00092E4393|nr:PREDICTED: armadillo repeat-containing protein 2 isoform X1 [Gavialis gangeticus]